MYIPNSSQRRTLAWIYFAYVMCYLVRKNYPMVLPSLASAGLLTTAQAGVVASVFEVVVGVVKFFCGVFVDRSPAPGRLLSYCLAVAGAACLMMQLIFWTLTGEMLALARLLSVTTLWSINGAAQAMAWPALARVFLAWFPDPATRGTWYSILCTNQNLGGVMAPVIYPPLMAKYGWEAALGAPAVLVLVYAAAMSFGLQSKPASSPENRATPESPIPATPKAKKPPRPGLIETFSYLLKMRSFVLLSIAYIPVMIIRQSLINWTAVIFDDAGMTLFQAGACISALELGGFFGGLSAGYLSDTLFEGRRGPVMAIFALLCVPLSLALPIALNSPEDGSVPKLFVLQVVFFCTGFASFPPHSLIGLMSREITPTEMNSTAGCLAKATGQLGAAAAGWPLQVFCAGAGGQGWGSIGYVNALSGVAACVAFSPLWTLTALKHRERKE